MPQRTAEQVAFEASWFDDSNNRLIKLLSRRFAHPPVDSDDLYQRTFLKLWSRPNPPTGRAVVYAAQDAMRHFRTTHFRRLEQKTTTQDESIDEAVPASGPGDAERKTGIKQAVVRARAIVETKLRGSAAGDRALAVLDAKLAGNDDTEELMTRLGATQTQIYEARRLAMSTLDAVIAGEQKAQGA